METIVRGKKVSFSVDEKSGQFRASVGGVDYRAETLVALKVEIERDLKKKPLKIRFVEVSEDYGGKFQVSKGVITGKHSGNGNLLVRYDGDNASSQHTTWRGKLLKDGTDVEELKRLKAASRQAEKTYDAFIEAHEIDTQKIGGDDEQEKG